MTISITIPGASFTNYVSNVELPYIEDAVSFQLYGVDAASSVLNRTHNPTANATLVGNPTYAANYATTSYTAGFDTGYLLDTPFTQVYIGRSASGGNSPIGRAPGGEAFVNMIQVISGAPNFTMRTWPNGVSGAALYPPASDMTQFLTLGSRWGGTGTGSSIFYINASGLQLSTDSDVTKTVTPTLNLRVGAGGNGTVGTWDVAATAFYGRVLTDTELREVHAYLKGLLAYRGVTIL